MGVCLNCGKPVDQKEKARAKKYCSNSCRLKAFYKRQARPKNVEVKVNNLNDLKTVTSAQLETKHPKYKIGDPREGSNAFFLKFGVFKYDEIK